MAEIVCKIVEDDGTEDSYGPIAVTADAAAAIKAILDPLEKDRQDDLEAQKMAAAHAENAARSAEAEAANQARIEAASRGETV